MYAQLREGSAWHNLTDLAPAIVDHDIDTRLCCLVSDDNHPHTIVGDGHLDRILRLAVSLGIDAVTAIQMVTINTATCFGVQADMGSVAPGKCADLVLLRDLTDFEATLVMIDGDVVAHDGKADFDVEPFAYPDWLTHTMNLGETIDESTFTIPAVTADGSPIPDGHVAVRAMGVNPGQTITKDLTLEAPVANGEITADKDTDLLKVFVFERHHATGKHAAGFVHGFGIHGALAQTVAHDAHNLLVMGDNDADMALAANTLAECGGGEVAVADGKVLGLVRLPVAGLMSDERVERVSDDVSVIEQAWSDMGCTMPSPFMTMGGMSLACIPELRLTDRGYVNCLTFQFEPLVVE
jgi:adenine deaminase